MCLDQFGLGSGTDPHRPGEIHGQHVSEDLRVMLVVAPYHAGGVDQDVEALQPGDYICDRSAVTNIERAEVDPSFIKHGCCPRPLGFARARCNDAGTKALERKRRTKTDSACTSNNQNLTAIEQSWRERVRYAAHVTPRVARV